MLILCLFYKNMSTGDQIMNVKGLIQKYEKKYWETRPQCPNRNHEIELVKKELIKEFLIDLEELENSSIEFNQEDEVE